MRFSTKMTLITASVVVALGLLVTISTYAVTGSALRQELEAKGLAVSRFIAEDIANPLLENELLVVQRALEDARAALPDMEYAYVIGFDGRLAAHTFPNGFPSALLDVNVIPSGQPSQVQVLFTERGVVQDIGLTVLHGLPAELHLGINDRTISTSLERTTGLLLGFTLLATLLGGVAAGLLGKRATRPLGDLAQSALRLGQGHLEEVIPIHSRDEIGELAADFNQMAGNLHASVGELRWRNQELSALNAVAGAVSEPLELTQALERALKAVLEATGFVAGWVFLTHEDGQRRPPVCWQGLPDDVVLQEGREPVPCLCHRAVEEQRPLVIGLQSACPALGVDLGMGKRIVCHATVPLVAKNRVLGVLNVASHEPAAFTIEMLELLGGIGRQLGVAIENARLWEELRRKEELRGQLLRKVITAQEEERKRIGRELHDETSQSLAALVVVLQAARSALSLDLEKCAERIDDAKTGVTQTLKELHTVIYELRPTLLDDLGLLPALRWCAQNRLEQRGVEVVWAISGEETRLPPEAETALFRIGQEAMTNAARHAHADVVQVRVAFAPTGVTLQVSDDGVGFDAAEIPLRPDDGSLEAACGQDPLVEEEGGPGLGLVGMEERAVLLGGQFSIQSARGQGVTVTAHIPLG